MSTDSNSADPQPKPEPPGARGLRRMVLAEYPENARPLSLRRKRLLVCTALSRDDAHSLLAALRPCHKDLKLSLSMECQWSKTYVASLEELAGLAAQDAAAHHQLVRHASKLATRLGIRLGHVVSRNAVPHPPKPRNRKPRPLTEIQKKCVELYLAEGCSRRKVARRLKVCLNTVQKALAKALKLELIRPDQVPTKPRRHHRVSKLPTDNRGQVLITSRPRDS